MPKDSHQNALSHGHLRLEQMDLSWMMRAMDQKPNYSGAFNAGEWHLKCVTWCLGMYPKGVWLLCSRLTQQILRRDLEESAYSNGCQQTKQCEPHQLESCPLPSQTTLGRDHWMKEFLKT